MFIYFMLVLTNGRSKINISDGYLNVEPYIFIMHAPNTTLSPHFPALIFLYVSNLLNKSFISSVNKKTFPNKNMNMNILFVYNGLNSTYIFIFYRVCNNAFRSITNKKNKYFGIET
jgi:hypothetical protein